MFRTGKTPKIWLGGGLSGAGEGDFYQCPQKVITAWTAAEAASALRDIDMACAEGRWVVAFLAYELGLALEPKLTPRLHAPSQFPLIWAGVFGSPQPLPLPPGGPVAPPGGFAPGLDTGAYLDRVEQIRAFIAAGDVYQVNFTYSSAARWSGDGTDLFRALFNAQPVPYPAYADLGFAEILSLSPELFFRIEGGRIAVKPMKGTAPRAPGRAADIAAARALQADPKNRAENLMIVDLMRNDLSRIARTGSVKTLSLFDVETYRTLHTLTSHIEADLADDWRPSEVIAALFPSGSVTGAPKIRAMELIDELECAPRGLYTGAIGVFRPDRSADFNITIRTLTLNPEGRLTLHLGGGIVYDSEPQAEADETRLKGRFASGLSPHAADQAPLRLIETIAWTPQSGFSLLEEHFARAEESAAYFGFPFDRAAAESLLHGAAAGAVAPLRLRLTLGQSGDWRLDSAPLGPSPAVWRFRISGTRIHSADPYRAHKTTRRGLYDAEFAAHTQGGACEDVLFLNEKNHLAEGSRTNLFLRRKAGDPLLTPPTADGALPGTLRAHLIAAGEAREASLTLKDLNAADEVFLGNSLRGLIKAVAV